MKKIEADCYFKLKEYEKAEEIYDKIIGEQIVMNARYLFKKFS